MTEEIVHADIAYEVSYTPRGARVPRTALLLETVPLPIRTLSAADAPVGLTHTVGEAVGHQRVVEGTVTSRAHSHVPGRRRTLADLAPRRGGPASGDDPWYASDGYPFASPTEIYRAKEAPLRPDDVDGARVHGSGRDEALRRANWAAERTYVLDGELWVPSAPFQWSVEINDGNVAIAPRLAASLSSSRFAAHDLHGAREFAAWLAADPWLTPPGCQVLEQGAIELAGEVPGIREGLLASAGHRLRDLHNHIAHYAGAGFVRLPPASLRAWADHMETWDAVAKGDAGSLLRAHGSLGPLLDALPRPAGRKPDLSKTPDFLRAMLAPPERHARTYLATALGPNHEREDVEFLAMA